LATVRRYRSAAGFAYSGAVIASVGKYCLYRFGFRVNSRYPATAALTQAARVSAFSCERLLA
jgi:hypothetical protein